NPVGFAMNHEGGNVDAGEILAEILIPGGDTGEAGDSGRASGSNPAGVHDLFADSLAQQQIRVVEVLEELCEEGVTVRLDRFLNSIEDAAVHTLRVVLGLEEKGRNRRDEHRPADAPGAVFSDV